MAKEKATKGKARKDGFPPSLIPDGRFHRCSICKTSFLTVSDRSLSEDFAGHVRRLHQPGQASEAVN
jgi:hypothetical protein